MKYILVTGAFGGMGRATVKALTEKGFRVFALDKRSESPKKTSSRLKPTLQAKKA